MGYLERGFLRFRNTHLLYLPINILVYSQTLHRRLNTCNRWSCGRHLLQGIGSWLFPVIPSPQDARDQTWASAPDLKIGGRVDQVTEAEIQGGAVEIVIVDRVMANWSIGRFVLHPQQIGHVELIPVPGR